MREKLEEIKKNALDVLQKATDIDALEEARIKFLGKKGELTAVLKGMGQLSKEERPQIGALANEIRGVIENHIDTKKAEISEKLEEIKLKSEVIDVTMPGKAQKTGKLHPLTKVMNNIKDTFIGMGFEIAEGPEVELDRIFTSVITVTQISSRRFLHTYCRKQVWVYTVLVTCLLE